MTAQVHVHSFGYGHAPPPEADMTLDLRHRFRNPHTDPAMRELTGLDDRVRDHVLDTPGIPAVVAAAIQLAIGVTSQGLDCDLAVGCVGGRHRSVAAAAEISRGLEAVGVTVTLEHRDIALPVIQK
ncbi:RNase adapter RapZ [Sphaerisporangium sp. NPDC049002]|uniref:RapZ C-terminal domain-containing protein n=1 Tax=Sphaerisporangium sp. NPDC049002 TaxID=3155392 RepID=UPI0033C41D4B